MPNTIKKMTLFAVAIFFLILDRIFKQEALANPQDMSPILGDWFNFQFTANENIAFSLPIFSQNVLIAINLAIVGVLIILLNKAWRKNQIADFFFFSLIILGAISNVYDRLMQGFVVDYFDLRYFTIFNMADAIITAGSIGLIANSVYCQKFKKCN